MYDESVSHELKQIRLQMEKANQIFEKALKAIEGWAEETDI